MDIVQVDLSIAGMEYLVSVSAYPYLMAQKRAGQKTYRHLTLIHAQGVENLHLACLENLNQKWQVFLFKG